MLKLLLLGALSAWTGIAQSPVSVLVVDVKGQPLQDVWVDGLTTPPLKVVTLSTGSIEGTAVSRRVAFRKYGFQTAIIPPQTGVTLNLHPAERSPIPRCTGRTNRATRFHLPKAKKPAKQTDIDYQSNHYAVQTKTGKHYLRHGRGSMWSYGFPTSSQFITSTDYHEESFFENGLHITQARGRSGKGAYWRFLGVFGETIDYETTDPEAVSQLDAIFDSVCLTTR